MGFNEIDLNEGIEIAQLLVKNHSKTLTLVDLNGNKFGEEGKFEIKQIMESIGDRFASLSEDEGSDDEEDGNQDEDANDDDEETEDENEEEEDCEIVDGDEDYEEYEDEDEDYEGEEGEEEEEQAPEQPQLFTKFKTDKPANPISNLNNLNLNACSPFGAKPTGGAAATNPFSQMAKFSNLMTSAGTPFDKFIINPTVENLKVIDEALIKTVAKGPKFDGIFVIRFWSLLAKLYDPKTKQNQDLVFKYADLLGKEYYEKETQNSTCMFANEMLTCFGMLKSEEKNFEPIELNESLIAIISNSLKQSPFQSQVKSVISNFINFRGSTGFSKALIENNKNLMVKCFAA